MKGEDLFVYLDRFILCFTVPRNKNQYTDLHFYAISDEMKRTKRQKPLQKYKLFCSIISWCCTAPARVECRLPPREAGIPLWCPLLPSNPSSSHLLESIAHTYPSPDRIFKDVGLSRGSWYQTQVRMVCAGVGMVSVCPVGPGW